MACADLYSVEEGTSRIQEKPLEKLFKSVDHYYFAVHLLSFPVSVVHLGIVSFLTSQSISFLNKTFYIIYQRVL